MKSVANDCSVAVGMNGWRLWSLAAMSTCMLTSLQENVHGTLHPVSKCEYRINALHRI